MEPKEPSPTHPNRTEHKQEPPTRSRGRPRLPTEQKEEPPKRPRGRPPTEQKEEPPKRPRGRPPTEQKEEPPKRPRGRPPLTIEQKEERKQLRLAKASQEQKQEQRARHAASQQQSLANLSPEDQEEQRARHAASQQQSLANLSPEDQEEQRARHAASQRIYHQVQRERTPRTYKKACASTLLQISDNDVTYFDIGYMDQICSYCGAFYWLREKNTHGIYQKCCHSGKVVLPAMPPPPPYVKSLLLRQGDDGVLFSKRPKTYNGWLSFASISLSAFPFTRGVPAMRIQGQIYHNLGPINPPEGVQPRNMQVLFHDCSKPEPFTDAEWSIALRIIAEIRAENSIYRSMNLRINELRHENAPTIDIVLGDRIPDNAPTRTYNLPTATEVAAIIIGSIEEGEAGNDSRSISVQLNGGGTQRLKTSSRLYDPLAYVLTHMRGASGWTYDIKCHGGLVDNNKNVSVMRFYAYRAQAHYSNMLYTYKKYNVLYLHPYL